jgi:ribonuclease D
MYTAMYADGVKSLIEQGWRAEMLESLDNFRSRVQKLCNVSPSADNGDA